MEEQHIGHRANKEDNVENKVYKLADATIAQIVQLIQMGILTGTDISDQMRTLRVIVAENETIIPDPNFVETFNSNLAKLEVAAKNESA